MPDLATLNLKIDSTSAKTAKTDLQNLTAAGKQAEDGVGGLRSKFESLNPTIERTGERLNVVKGIGEETVGAFARMATQIVTAYASFEGAKRIIESQHEFEEALLRTRFAFGLSEQALDQYATSVIEISEATGVSAQEVLGLSRSAAQLGTVGVEGLIKYTNAFAQLADITGTDGRAIQDSLLQFMKLTHATADEAEGLASALVGVGGKSLEAQQSVVGMATILASGMSAFGQTKEGALGLAGALRMLGFDSGRSAQAINQVFFALDEAARSGGTKAEEVLRVTGRSAKEMGELLERDATGAVLVLLQGLKRVQDEGGSMRETLEKLGLGGGMLSKVLPQLAASYDKVAASVNKANREIETGDALARAGAQTDEFLANSLEKLSASVNGFFLRLRTGGSGFKDFIDSLTGGIQRISASVEQSRPEAGPSRAAPLATTSPIAVEAFKELEALQNSGVASAEALTAAQKKLDDAILGVKSSIEARNQAAEAAAAKEEQMRARAADMEIALRLLGAAGAAVVGGSFIAWVGRSVVALGAEVVATYQSVVAKQAYAVALAEETALSAAAAGATVTHTGILAGYTAGTLGATLAKGRELAATAALSTAEFLKATVTGLSSTATASNTVASIANAASKGTETIATMALAGAQGVLAAGYGIVTTAAKALGAALLATPVGVIIAGIVALTTVVFAVVQAYKAWRGAKEADKSEEETRQLSDRIDRWARLNNSLGEAANKYNQLFEAANKAASAGNFKDQADFLEQAARKAETYRLALATGEKNAYNFDTSGRATESNGSVSAGSRELTELVQKSQRALDYLAQIREARKDALDRQGGTEAALTNEEAVEAAGLAVQEYTEKVEKLRQIERERADAVNLAQQQVENEIKMQDAVYKTAESYKFELEQIGKTSREREIAKRIHDAVLSATAESAAATEAKITALTEQNLRIRTVAYETAKNAALASGATLAKAETLGQKAGEAAGYTDAALAKRIKDIRDEAAARNQSAEATQKQIDAAVAQANAVDLATEAERKRKAIASFIENEAKSSAQVRISVTAGSDLSLSSSEVARREKLLQIEERIRDVLTAQHGEEAALMAMDDPRVAAAIKRAQAEDQVNSRLKEARSIIESVKTPLEKWQDMQKEIARQRQVLLDQGVSEQSVNEITKRLQRQANDSLAGTLNTKPGPAVQGYTAGSAEAQKAVADAVYQLNGSGNDIAKQTLDETKRGNELARQAVAEQKRKDIRPIFTF